MTADPPEPHAVPPAPPLPPRQRRPIAQIVIVAVVTASYALVFFPAYKNMGIIAASLSVLPIALAGWFFGRRGGLLAGLSSIPLHIILFTLAGGVGWLIVLQQWPGSALGIVAGVLVGWLGEVLRRVQTQARDLVRERAALRAEIAERERVEIALHQATHDAEAANRAKSAFLTNMSHELRTPLAAILGWADILREEMCGPITPEQREGLDTIDHSAKHLLALISDILDLAKIEAGKARLELGPVVVGQLCQASIELIAVAAAKKRLLVTLTIDPQVPLLLADQRALTQILVNLLSNAVKFTPEQGRVGLEVRGDREQHVVSFTVWDTGIGIAPADQERVFQPFVQIDSSLSRQQDGTGLGLALVARLVELHGGTIGVESAVGQGTRFTVALPWHALPEQTTAEGTGKDAAAAHGGGGSGSAEGAGAVSQQLSGPALVVIVAEDNQTNSQVIGTYLRANGYHVIDAQNGQEALARARETRPAAVVMDIQMPGMNGLETIQAMRADPQLAAIPIIVLTALALPGDRERCMAAGASAYLSKPINLKRLAQEIAAHTNSRGSAQPREHTSK